jgi:hypothetical protein
MYLVLRDQWREASLAIRDAAPPDPQTPDPPARIQ